MELTHSLQSAFIPRAVAVVGASDRSASRGTFVWNGVMNGKRALEAYPVNPKYKYIGVVPCWSSLSELPTTIDLAVIATPAHTVMGLLKECKKLGIANVLLTPGNDALTGDRHWRAEVADFARKAGIRLIGPDSMGIMRPSIGLNVSYWPQLAETGNVGLLSQSGAVTATILDYASRAAMGFSTVISSGLESDVTLAEIVEFLANDPETGIIAMHIETLRHPREFYSAVRAAVRRKPVILLKASRGSSAGRLIASRLAAPVGDEAVFDAMLERAGAIRCERIEEFCSTLEVFAGGKNPRQGRLAVLANGLGFASLSADAVDAAGVHLAEFSNDTQRKIKALLKPATTLTNPLTLGSDAAPEVFAQVLELVLTDNQVDGAVISLAPSAMTQTPRTVQLIADAADKSFKPVIVNWVSDAPDADMRLSFKRCRLPLINTPDLAARAFKHLADYEYLKERRMLVPQEGSQAGNTRDLTVARVVVDEAKLRKEHILSEEQTVQLLSAFGIKSLPSAFANTAEEAVSAARRIGFPVVLKLSADGIAHKTDVGGVALNVLTENAVASSFEEIRSRIKKLAPMALFKGVFVQQMATNPHARELSVRVATDPVLGPAVYFGAGGRTGELFDTQTIDLLPLTEPLARELIEKHPIAQALGVFREMPAIDKDALVQLLLRVSRLVCEIPAVAEVSVNPLIADENGVTALDSSIALNAKPAVPDADYSHMLIAPPSTLCEEDITTKAGLMRIRSIRADDFEPLKRMYSRLSQKTAYMRFHKDARELTDVEIIDFTQIDHDREAARIIVDNSSVGPEIHGVGRIFMHPDSDTAEFGILIEDQYQRAGFGALLMQRLENEARRRGMKTIEGFVLKGNDAMAGLMSRRGYRAKDCPEDANMLVYSLSL